LPQTRLLFSAISPIEKASVAPYNLGNPVTLAMEIVRLVIGLAIALLHRPIADFMLEQEASLVVLFRQRGLVLPSVPRRSTVYNLYFLTGIGIALFEIARIWLLMR